MPAAEGELPGPQDLEQQVLAGTADALADRISTETGAGDEVVARAVAMALTSVHRAMIDFARRNGRPMPSHHRCLTAASTGDRPPAPGQDG